MALKVWKLVRFPCQMLIAPKLFGVNIYFDHRNKGFLWFLFYLRKEVKK